VPTPIRDKLSINPEEGLDVGDTPQAMHNYQRQVNMIHLSEQHHHKRNSTAQLCQ
jgi:hypothetical protein